MSFLRPALALLPGLLVAVLASAQSLTEKGSESALDVAAWNVRFLGDPGQLPEDDILQLANVRRIIAESGIELWALQEVTSEDIFQSLLGQLGSDWDGIIAPTSVAARLGIGFVYRTDVIRRRSQITEILVDDPDGDFAGRPPLLMEAEVTLPDTTAVVTLIALHMKARDDLTSYNKRMRASRRLKSYIDFTSLASAAVVVLGDLNDLLVGSITAGMESPYANFVSDQQRYMPLTLALQDSGRATFCGFGRSCSSGSTIDHILISDELFEAYVHGSVDHYIELVSEVARYTTTTSDHLPAFARFDFVTSVGVASSDDARTTGPAVSVYPMPVTESTRLVWTGLSALSPTTITLHDVLGRKIGRAMAHESSGERDWPWPGLAPGVYLVSAVSDSGQMATRMIVVP